MIKTPSKIRRRPQKERNLTAIDGETISDYLKTQEDLLQQRENARTTEAHVAYMSVKDNRIGHSIPCQLFSESTENNKVSFSKAKDGKKLVRKPTAKKNW